MFSAVAYIVTMGGINRLKGWGAEKCAESKLFALVGKWLKKDPCDLMNKVVKFFGIWTCGACVLLVTFLYCQDFMKSLVVAAGYMAWRAPHIGTLWGPEVEDAFFMFFRGMLPTLPLFIALSWFEGVWPFAFLLSPVMGVWQATCYNGIRRYHDYGKKNFDVAIPQEWLSCMGLAGLVLAAGL